MKKRLNKNEKAGLYNLKRNNATAYCFFLCMTSIQSKDLLITLSILS